MAMHEGHYQRALAYLEACDWAAAEGVLLQARLTAGQRDLAVADALAYALLMQGDYEGCARVLEPVLDHPQRSFWIHHKYGDALRGLHDLERAAQHFRQALADGSTSPLTARNLMQVLHEVDPSLALAELEAWPKPLPPERLAGVQQAAALVAGLDLAAWLLRHNLADAVLRRRLLEQRLYSLELDGLETPVMQPILPTDEASPAERWCEALRERLERMGLSAGFAG